MIRRLIILLLIVGCAPTKPPEAIFYIGMSEKEFMEQNNIDFAMESIIGVTNKDKSVKYTKINPLVLPKDSLSTLYAEFSNNILKPYYFEFRNDTLAGVYGGVNNYGSGK